MTVRAWLRNIYLIPFWFTEAPLWLQWRFCSSAGEFTKITRSGYSFCVELTITLGSTNSWLTSIVMKPFPTSVLKGPTWVFATFTKICTGGSSINSLEMTSEQPSQLTTYLERCHSNFYLHHFQGITRSSLFERHQFSGLVHLAGMLLHTS